MKELLLDTLGVFASISPMFVPILIAGLYDSYKEKKRLKEEKERIQREYERKLEMQAYAFEFYLSQIDDMIEHGTAGKVLKHLIETGQL